ncbi:MAG: 16S rRNA (guanine(966)-N(2))-methyltransferase RsmD [Acidimicrobiia bacterium]|nr:16S rRNA (guanine(966)-N(2))-methyltransferase RsmD [Acidimicrobiia bacterium]
MRVVAGELRGRRIVVPPTGIIRPTTDKVREAVFNALTSLDAIVGARVADLFAGSGAFGIEALSRGAAHCTFIERDRTVIRAIDENVAVLGLRDRATVRLGDAVALAPSVRADVVFADPPYGFEGWERLLDRLDAGLVVAEGSGEVPAPEGWQSSRVKRYGRTWVTFLERLG